LDGIEVQADIFIETYQVPARDLAVCFTWNDKAAGIVRPLGQRKLWLIGTCIGSNGTAYIEKTCREEIKKMLRS
jgi:hypothetical protein